MKKIITISTILLATTMSSFAAEFIEVTKMSVANNTTTVELKRYSANNTLFVVTKRYSAVLTAQDAVDKAAYISDEGITAFTSIASTTPKVGTQGAFGQLRVDAYRTGGLSGYFKELARQFALEN